MSNRLIILISLACAACASVPAGSPGSASAELQQHTLTSSGAPRSFWLYHPDSAKPGAPLLFVLHGSTGTGAQIRRTTAERFDRLADQYGFTLIYPDGFERHWNDCRGSASYSANIRNIDDPRFFRDMVAFVQASTGSPPARVDAVGHSNGGHMAFRLGYEAADLVTAITAISANLPEVANSDCRPSHQPVTVMLMNGTDDPINPYQGGVVTLNGDASRGQVMSADASARYWASLITQHKPIKKTLRERDGNPQTRVIRHLWQGEQHHVALYTLQGSGHVIPGPELQFPASIGPDAGDISAPDIVVQTLMGKKLD
ncbi:MAG: PHB depolymerase family esterase [Pseudomonadota bacterium]